MIDTRRSTVEGIQDLKDELMVMHGAESEYRRAVDYRIQANRREDERYEEFQAQREIVRKKLVEMGIVDLRPALSKVGL